MKEKVRVYYDDEADYLELNIGKPTKSYYDDLGEDIFQRIDEKTGKIKGWAIFGFRKRAKAFKLLGANLPEKMQINDAKKLVHSFVNSNIAAAKSP